MIRLKDFLSLSLNGGVVQLSAAEKALIAYTKWTPVTSSDYVTDGVELVAGGSFNTPNSLDGWTSSYAAGVLENNAVRVNGEGTIPVNQNLYTPEFILETGATYLLKTDILEKAGSTGWNLSGLVFKDTGLVYKYPTTIGSFIYELVATSSVGKVGLHCGTAVNASALFDNISVQKVIQEPNKRYIKDEGKSPKYPLVLYSGSGTSFNGTNQSVDINIPTPQNGFTINFTTVNAPQDTTLKIVLGWDTSGTYIFTDESRYWFRVFGTIVDTGISITESDICSLIWNSGNTSFTFKTNNINEFTSDNTLPTEFLNFNIARIGCGYLNSSTNRYFYDGTLKDLYLFNRALTTTEQEKYTSQPEQFYIDALADDTCVLNMPMCDTDTNVRDMANYSEGANTTNLLVSFTKGTVVSTNNSVLCSGATTDDFRYFVIYKSKYTTLPDNTIYKKVIKAKSSLGTAYMIDSETGTKYNIGTTTTTINIIGNSKSGTLGYDSYFAMNGETLEIESVESYEITAGLYPLLNHTTDTNINNLQYGTQNLKLPMDSLGKRDGYITPWIKGDGVGYGDTGWIPPSNSDWSIEGVINFNKLDVMRIVGVYSNTSSERIFFQKHSNNNFRMYVGSNGSGYLTASGTFQFCMTYSSTTKSGSFFINGIEVSTYTNTDYAQGSSPFYLGASSRDGEVYSSFKDDEGVVLFKVHDKALTQEEVTTAFQDAQAKGLLA